MTNQQAADLGKALGQSQDALITPTINQANANSNIQHVTGAPPETQFFGGGQANNFSAGENKRLACKNGTPSTDKWTQQSCDAVNLIANAPAVRPKITISRSNPMLVREQAVRANAAAIAFGAAPGAPAGTVANNPNGFGIAGTYSGCTTTTTPDPVAPTIKTCVDYTGATQSTGTSTCQKSMATTQTCHQVMSFTVTQPAPIPATPNYSCSGAGYSLSGTNCTAPATAANPTYSCTSGSLSGTMCYYPAYQPAGSAATATINNYAPTGCKRTVFTSYGTWIYAVTCYASSVTVNGTLLARTTNGNCAALPTSPVASGTSYVFSRSADARTCYVHVSNAGAVTPPLGQWTSGYSTTTYSCPSGYTLSGTTCYPPMVTPPPTVATITYSCAAPSTLSGTSCVWPTVTANVVYTCGAGMTLSGSTCIPAPVVAETYTDGCAALQAKTQ